MHSFEVRHLVNDSVSASKSPALEGRPRPVLRWAGSKRLLLPKLLDLAADEYDRYIEPFCGSACYFLALSPGRSILSDLNPHLIATYKQIKAHPLAVARAMSTWKSTKEGYLEARAIIPRDAAKAAARFLFLNRYSFNGVYRENRKGEFNVPYGGYRNGGLPRADDLLGFSTALARTRLVCSDFEEVICEAGRGDFLYLDPPYHYGSARNRGEYGYGAFAAQDLKRFVASVSAASKRGAHILISYNKAHMLQKSLRGWRLAYCATRRSIAGFTQSRRVVREYLLKNY